MQLSEQVRKREENMHNVDMVLREKDHTAQAEKLQMTAKVTDTVEDINKRLLSKEMKIREDIQGKYLQLEKVSQSCTSRVRNRLVNFDCDNVVDTKTITR